MPRRAPYLFALVLVWSPVARAAYDAVELLAVQPPGASYCSPPTVTALNNDGSVAGWGTCYFCVGNGCVGHNFATRWVGGVPTILPTPTGFDSQAGGMNEAGDVVGGIYTYDSATQAFLGNAFLVDSGGYHALPGAIDAPRGYAAGINDTGRIVGRVDADPGISRPAVWQGTTLVTADIAALGAGYSYAIGVDDAGTVLIEDGFPEEQDGNGCEFLRLWTPGGSSAIGPEDCRIDADESFIARSGAVYGTWYPDTGTSAAQFVPGGAVPLGTLGGTGGERVRAANRAGVAVGMAYLPVPAPGVPFAYSIHSVAFVGGEAIDLNTYSSTGTPGGAFVDPLGRQLVSAAAINDRGQIVSSAGANETNTVFLLTPVCGDGPDPGQPCDDANANDHDACRNDCTPNVCGDAIVRTGVEQCDDGNTAGGDGCAADCTLESESISGVVGAGGTLSTNASAGGVATPGNPVATSVTVPSGGAVTIDEIGQTDGGPAGYTLLGTAVDITAPPGTAEEPLQIEFRLDGSIIPPDETAATLMLFRNGVAVPDCPDGLAGGAVPSPCVALRETLGDGDVHLVVFTIAASRWAVGAATTCGNGQIDPGEECDGGACCTSDCAFALIGTVCRPASGACDVAETCGGLRATCPIDTRLPDADADGICDGADPCVNGSTLASPVLKVTKLGPPMGDEKLRLKGAMPPPGDIDPVRLGARVILRDGSGAGLLDVRVPAGAFDTATKQGWKVNGAGTAWRWKGNVAGLVKVALKDKGTEVKVTVVGKNMALPTPTQLPLAASLVLSPPVASGSLCSEPNFSECMADAGGTSVRCR